MTNTRPTRRQFLRSTLATSSLLAFPFVSSRNILGANSKLNIAGIGAAGKGAVDITACGGENIVALCDIDENRFEGMAKKFPAARRFKDYRKMLETDRSIDAVTVSIADHSHFHAAMHAIKHGKHVYCQKPLTHTVFEARRLTQAARSAGVATQMGNQHHANPHTRRDVELLQAGVIGDVTEVHVWTDRPGSYWPQGLSRPQDTPAVPAGVDWDLWIGPAPMRPYHPSYHPFKWRGFWDFGTGALGDMGCHLLDLPHWALELGAPVSITPKMEGGTNESAPLWSILEYQFAARGSKPAVKMIWYDAGKKPSRDIVKGGELKENGLIFVGSKDTMYLRSHVGEEAFTSGAKMDDFKSVPEKFVKKADSDAVHYGEWINACKGGPKALSNFDIAGPLTETVLLGNVAIRAGERIEWDPKSLRVTNIKSANQFVDQEYRKGWEI